MANSSPAHFSSSAESWSATPRSIARPRTNGITAWVLIQMMPKSMPSARVCHCPLASHHRYRPGDRWSAVPGWSRGSLRTRPTVRTSGKVSDRFSARSSSVGRAHQLQRQGDQEAGEDRRDRGPRRRVPSCRSTTTSKTSDHDAGDQHRQQGQADADEPCAVATSRSLTCSPEIRRCTATGVITTAVVRAATITRTRKRVCLEVVEAGELRRERQGQQEAGGQLRAGLHDPELLRAGRAALAVEPLVIGLGSASLIVDPSCRAPIASGASAGQVRRPPRRPGSSASSRPGSSSLERRTPEPMTATSIVEHPGVDQQPPAAGQPDRRDAAVLHPGLLDRPLHRQERRLAHVEQPLDRVVDVGAGVGAHHARGDPLVARRACRRRARSWRRRPSAGRRPRSSPRCRRGPGRSRRPRTPAALPASRPARRPTRGATSSGWSRRGQGRQAGEGDQSIGHLGQSCRPVVAGLATVAEHGGGVPAPTTPATATAAAAASGRRRARRCRPDQRPDGDEADERRCPSPGGRR